MSRFEKYIVLRHKNRHYRQPCTETLLEKTRLQCYAALYIFAFSWQLRFEPAAFLAEDCGFPGRNALGVLDRASTYHDFKNLALCCFLRISSLVVQFVLVLCVRGKPRAQTYLPILMSCLHYPYCNPSRMYGRLSPYPFCHCPHNTCL